MFVGTYEPKLDDKGRLILPAKYREPMAGGVYITRAQDRCLAAYPRHEFERLHTLISETSSADKGKRSFMRMFLANASEEVPDRQGRITIPAALRNYAGLERDLAVVGAGSKIEIWDAAAWATYLAENEQAFADLSEEVVPGL